jgi:uncharacterized protein affecting Mg2+/Co2+ transport
MCGEGGTRYFFGYSVRFRLLAPEEQLKRARLEREGGEAAEWQQAGAGPARRRDGEDAAAAGADGAKQQQRQQQQQRPANGRSGHANGASAGAGGGESGGGGGADGGGGGAAGPPPVLRRCQLESRHWRILGPGGEPANEVSGEGVIGEHPALEAGGEEFAYQSCTHQAERLGFMEGGFTFVEGSLARPEGPAFVAECPRFELRVPDFIY